MPDITVIICTYNPRQDYLERTLEGLRRQTLPIARWELLLIDNNSKEPVSARFDLSWHPQGRHLVEVEQGLTAARLRGIQEAQSELLLFVDDDNVLIPDYLEKSLAIAASKPFLGAWGGTTKGVYETEPPAWFHGWAAYIGVRTIKRMNWTNVPCRKECSPIGAGLSVRRSVARAYAEAQRQSNELKLDRCGDKLLGCGDLDLAFHALKLDMGYGVTPELELDHLIPPVRLQLDYLERLVEQTMLSYALLQKKWDSVEKSYVQTGWKKNLLKRWQRRKLSNAERTLAEAIDRGYLLGQQMLK